MKIERILLTEDEITFKIKLTYILRNLGYEGEFTHHKFSDTTKEEYVEGHYDVVLLDINLKQSTYDGLQIAEWIKSLNGTPVFIISTSDGDRKYNNDHTERQYAEHIGCAGYINKGGAEMIDRIKNMMEDVESGSIDKFKYYG